MKHERAGRAVKEKRQLLDLCTPSFYILHVCSIVSAYGVEAARMAWNHEVAGSGRGVGRFFWFLFEQGEGPGWIASCRRFLHAEAKTMETDNELAQIKCWAKIAERNAWTSLVGLTWHVKSTYDFWKKRAPLPSFSLRWEPFQEWLSATSRGSGESSLKDWRTYVHYSRNVQDLHMRDQLSRPCPSIKCPLPFVPSVCWQFFFFFFFRRPLACGRRMDVNH